MNEILSGREKCAQISSLKACYKSSVIASWCNRLCHYRDRERVVQLICSFSHAPFTATFARLPRIQTFLLPLLQTVAKPTGLVEADSSSFSPFLTEVLHLSKFKKWGPQKASKIFQKFRLSISLMSSTGLFGPNLFQTVMINRIVMVRFWSPLRREKGE